MALEKITLYHGGNLDQVSDLRAWGLNHQQSFYCTRDRGLAEEARNSHGIDGTLLKIEVPKNEFVEGLEKGYLEERPYMGCIPVDFSREVEVKPGKGTAFMSQFIRQR
jgi:hypothetical protein